MCEVRRECQLNSRFWVQALFPKTMTEDCGCHVGRSITSCAIHLPAAIRLISESQDRIIREHFGNTMVSLPNYSRLTVKERTERGVYV